MRIRDIHKHGISINIKNVKWTEEYLPACTVLCSLYAININVI
jgi:hypothetical protein